MSEEQMPDIHSPEFRSVMLEHFMGVKERATIAVSFAGQAKNLTFDELTPAIWAQLVSYMDEVEATAKYVLASIDAMDFFIDDPESMNKVKDAVQASCNKCGCDKAKHTDNGCLGIQRLSNTDGYGESCRCDGFEER